MRAQQATPGLRLGHCDCVVGGLVLGLFLRGHQEDAAIAKLRRAVASGLLGVVRIVVASTKHGCRSFAIHSTSNFVKRLICDARCEA